MSNLTRFFEEDVLDLHQGLFQGFVWIGAKEREDDRGSYVFLNGSELSSDHPAWPEWQDQPPRSAESEQAFCVGHRPHHGLTVMKCNDEHDWLQNMLCDNGQVVSMCSWHECPDWGGQEWYLRKRSKPC